METQSKVDILIRNGMVFDGSGQPGQREDIAINNGTVIDRGVQLSYIAAETIDAQGLWVTPGFVDMHTHYDAEIEADSGLRESVRHGVTTVVMGNCSLSLALGDAEQLIDLFSRVENLSKETLKSWLRHGISWKTPHEYYEHLEQLPLGPNVSTFLGHSNLRLAAMGPYRSLMAIEPNEEEMATMNQLLGDALSCGYLGLSIDMLPWHRMEGRHYGGTSIPSQQASLKEYKELASIIREQEGVLQATPNANKKQSVVHLLMMSSGLFRKPLKLTALAALDFTSNRIFPKLTRLASWFANKILRGNFRFQALAGPFQMWSDGFKTPVFEEFPAGERLMTEDRINVRHQLLTSAVFRHEFRQQWQNRFNRSFHRDLNLMTVTSAPDASLNGKTFTEIAAHRKQDSLECFLDLLAEFDEKIRWHTVIANDRPKVMRSLLTAPYNFPGFSDAGAHNRNMAFQNIHLHMLRDAQKYPDGLSIAEAVHKITGHIAEWLGLDCGTIAIGKTADICIIDPIKLNTDLQSPEEVADPLLNGEMRMITRSGDVVQQVFIGGRQVFKHGSFSPEYGQVKIGRLLRRKKSESARNGIKPHNGTQQGDKV